MVDALQKFTKIVQFDAYKEEDWRKFAMDTPQVVSRILRHQGVFIYFKETFTIC
jgi:hypothetical protein